MGSWTPQCAFAFEFEQMPMSVFFVENLRPISIYFQTKTQPEVFLHIDWNFELKYDLTYGYQFTIYDFSCC